jgi:deazaflavin-dependent oxidoreductase (nitroreductase family)
MSPPFNCIPVTVERPDRVTRIRGNVMVTGVNQQAVEEFRRNRGALGGPVRDARTVLLTTTDPGTGASVVRPVDFHHDDQGRLLLVAAAADDGAPPEWYRHVLAGPRVRVETGTSIIEAEAEVLTGAEHATAYRRMAEVTPALAPAPIVALRPRSRSRMAAVAWGDELKAVHDGLRRELALIRRELAAGGPGLAAQLRVNCLTACGMLRHHHLSEDDEVFPLMERRRPEIAAVLARLRTQHQEMGVLLEQLRSAVSGPAADSGPALAELDRLTAALEAHLDDEEEQLIPLLNAVDMNRRGR